MKKLKVIWMMLFCISFSLFLAACQNDIKEVKFYDVYVDDILYQVEENKTLPTITPKEKEGYRFIGFFEKDEEFKITTPITKDMRIYAKYELITIKYSLTLDLNGGTYDLPTTLSLSENETFTLGEPTLANHSFVGWKDKETNEFFNANQIFRDTKLEAIYAPLPVYYEVKLNLGGGTINGLEVFSVLKDTTLELNVSPTKIHHTFEGWYLDTELGVPYVFLPVTNNLTLYAKYTKLKYELTLELNGGVYDGDTVLFIDALETVTLNTPTKEGHIFVGWYLDSNFNEGFNHIMTTDTKVYAKFILQTESNLNAGAYFESLYAIFIDSNPKQAKAYYKKHNHDTWNLVDESLVRKVDNITSRVDIVGLTEGYYDIKIISSQNEIYIKENIFTEAHDRSGYAHFNYQTGIGGYLDDGTLKPNAHVIYVTEENKNEVTLPGVKQVGLGWILNNAQYSKSGSSTYNLLEANQSISSINYPVVIRIIGKVTAPLGVTGYDSLINGGSAGDNGNMVRIKDANHLTIEGIGEDATIEGWGIHFMASTQGRGIGFHVRNLTFINYPEDAIGLEGVQSGSTLTIPVQRGWMHHLTFYPGYSANPAESDKAHGDGSLDIKRGLYFTVSYSRFMGAHKTNLVGASDDNHQYHLTFHHNYWQNNASRIPLARKANIHMYNNVFETTDDNQNEASYAQNTRANAYIFSEANYFYATKSPSDVRSGAIKSYQDVKYSTYNLDGATVVENRTDLVQSGNTYEHFDTNKDVFYYDEINKVSKVKHLTDAVIARSEVSVYSGTYKVYEKPNIDNHKITNITPTVITDTVEVNTRQKINKGMPLLVFSVDVNAIVTIEQDSSQTPPALVTIYGEYLLVGSGTVNLTPGIYVIESRISHGASKGQSQAKESGIFSYKIELDSKDASEARINRLNDLLNNLGEISYSQAYEEKLQLIKDSYLALTYTEKQLFDEMLIEILYDNYHTFVADMIESMIESIGEVNSSKVGLITDIDLLIQKVNQEVIAKISNMPLFRQAQIELASLKVTYINETIPTMIDVSTLTFIDNDLRIHQKSYSDLMSLYETLSIEQRNEIINITKVENGLVSIDKLLKMNDLYLYALDLNIDELERNQMALFNSYYQFYLNLNEDDKTSLHMIEDILTVANEKFNTMRGTSYYFIPESNTNTNNYFTFIGDAFVTNAGSFIIDDLELTKAAKLNSNASISFETTVDNATLRIYIKTRTTQNQGKVTIDGIIYDLDIRYDERGIAYIEIELNDAKVYEITRNNRELAVFFIEVIE